MSRKFVASLGRAVTFPDNWSEDQINAWINKQSGDGETDVIGALKHGWKSGWADTADSYSDYKDALFRLIPGIDPKEDFLIEPLSGSQKPPRRRVHLIPLPRRLRVV